MNNTLRGILQAKILKSYVKIDEQEYDYHMAEIEKGRGQFGLMECKHGYFRFTGRGASFKELKAFINIK